MGHPVDSLLKTLNCVRVSSFNNCEFVALLEKGKVIMVKLIVHSN